MSSGDLGFTDIKNERLPKDSDTVGLLGSIDTLQSAIGKVYCCNEIISNVVYSCKLITALFFAFFAYECYEYNVTDVAATTTTTTAAHAAVVLLLGILTGVSIFVLSNFNVLQSGDQDNLKLISLTLFDLSAVVSGYRDIDRPWHYSLRRLKQAIFDLGPVRQRNFVVPTQWDPLFILLNECRTSTRETETLFWHYYCSPSLTPTSGREQSLPIGQFLNKLSLYFFKLLSTRCCNGHTELEVYKPLL